MQASYVACAMFQEGQGWKLHSLQSQGRNHSVTYAAFCYSKQVTKPVQIVKGWGKWIPPLDGEAAHNISSYVIYARV